jgi:hypothetical protein
MKLKAIALASIFAMFSTLAFAGVGSADLPENAPPGSGNGGSGVTAPGSAAERAERMRWAPTMKQENTHRRHHKARRHR